MSKCGAFSEPEAADWVALVLSSWGGMAAIWSDSGEHFACESLSLLYTSVINIVAVNICFLISLLFPVNCSYSNLRSLPFVPPVVLSSHHMGGGGGRSEQYVFFVGTLYCSV